MPGAREPRRRSSRPPARPRADAARRRRRLADARERERATGAVLRIIAASPTGLEPALQAIAEQAARLCDARDATILLVEGDRLRIAAHHGPIPAVAETVALGRGSVSGRAVLERRVVQVRDLRAAADFPEGQALARRAGHRTTLAMPLVRQGVPIGAILIRRPQVRAFAAPDIALLETFAAQAVIAIENARLFTELGARNRELTEALERQTATAEILRVISRSPTDVQPVLDAILATALRLCGARNGAIFRFDGEAFRIVASSNVSAGFRAYLERTPIRPGRGTPVRRVGRERRPVQTADILADPDLGEAEPYYRAEGMRTAVAVPMLKDDVLVGAISFHRGEVRPFTDQQIELLATFASQAVIAIENVRLFKELAARNRELTDALERERTTSGILRTIANSPTDIQPVFDMIAESAARLCDAEVSQVARFDGELLHLGAHYGVSAAGAEAIGRTFPRRPGGASASERAVRDRAVVHIPDVVRDEDYRIKDAALAAGFRAALGVPMLREDRAVGAIVIGRATPGVFSPSHVELLRTFADQAVIAIENVRLFQELQARNRELTEALDQRTATSEILRVISSAHTDVQPVFDTIVQSAARLCGAATAAVFRVEGGWLHHPANWGGAPDALAAARARYPRPVGTDTVPGQAILARAPVQVPDVDDGSVPPTVRDAGRLLGFRSCVAVPMLAAGEAVGAIVVTRRTPGPFTDAEVALLGTFSDQAVIAIDNVRLFQELRARTEELARSVEELRALGEVGRAVSSTLDLDAVLETIVARADELSGTDGGAIYEYDEGTERFELRVTRRLEDELVAELRRGLRLGEGAVGRAGATGAPVRISDILAEESYDPRLRGLLERAGFRALLAVPLRREERLIGALVLRRRVPGPFPDGTVLLLQTFAAQSGLAIQNARLFRELEEKSRQLEVASRHKSQFLANMSHELRTPLNAILGYTELILDGIYGEVPARAREVMERIDRSGRHLLGLINDVLDLSKIEAGQLTLSLADYSLRDVVQTVHTAVEALAAEKGLALRVTVAPDLPPGRGDERRLTQVLLNLVGNAVKFTETGEVAIEAAAGDGCFVVSVADSGPGIAAADQQRIFEEFQQADTSSTRRTGGTGLGLSIARRIVELHGGRLGVESAPGRGSTFTFTVPVRVERPATRPA